jgi:hypothetical protein
MAAKIMEAVKFSDAKFCAMPTVVLEALLKWGICGKHFMEKNGLWHLNTKHSAAFLKPFSNSHSLVRWQQIAWVKSQFSGTGLQAPNQ